MSSINFYPLTISSVRRDTREALVLSLRPADKDTQYFRFKSGQYLTFKAQIDGQEFRRSYSICSSETDQELRVGIKRVEDGVFSSWIHQHAHVGQTLFSMSPQGKFNVKLNAAHKNHYLCIAAGSGITPILGILKSVLQLEPQSLCTLVYGNRSSNNIMFKEELEDLKNTYMTRFNLIHIMSREQQDIELFNGRIDAKKCKNLFERWINIHDISQTFICGPQQMSQDLIAVLDAHGQDKSRVKFELFGSEHNTSKSIKRAKARASNKQECVATIIMDGHARSLTLGLNQLSLLDAALKEGMDLPHACKGGVCSTCKALLVEGQVDMDANFALEDYEIKRGYILCCQSYPLSKKLVVNFDK